MNDEEKQAVKDFEDLLKKHFEETSVTSFNFLDGVEGIYILNIIEKQQKEIEKLKEAYQTLKDDIEGHNVVYVDTPEFEENYISKDKIKEKIEKIKEDEEFYRERDRMYEFDGKINILKDLLGE